MVCEHIYGDGGDCERNSLEARAKKSGRLLDDVDDVDDSVQRSSSINSERRKL